MGIDDNCSKVLQKALQKHGVRDGIQYYAIRIQYDNKLRDLGPTEMPLAIFKDLEREGRMPKFMLWKLPEENIRFRQKLLNSTQGNSI
jgi:hypothetical protein